ncbi:MAG: sugar transferase [Planctomycetota bacterium]
MWYLTQRLVAFVGLLLLLPVFAFLWMLVKATSEGPFLYSQTRPGLHGVPIRIWKIRTMVPGSDKNLQNARCVLNNNPNVTYVGRILRILKLDELPQLWNIVIGQMAFVGPRPIAFSLHQELCMMIPGFEKRTGVRPGLSNIGQVSIEENASGDQLIHDWRERFEAETHYLRNRSIGYDCVVILLTVLYLLRKAWRLRGKRPRTKIASQHPEYLLHQSRTA